MTRLPGGRLIAPTILLAVLANGLLATAASAHVKWFCAYDLAGHPVGLENVLCSDLEFLTGLSLLNLMIAALIERTSLGEAMIRALDRVTGFLQDSTELLFRAGCAFFFIAIWAVGGIMLTPELKTDSVLIGAIQLGIATGMLWRCTMPVSALGIVVIFASAIWQYGVFHLADYPIFLGIAAYLALVGLGRDFFGLRPIDIVRWSAGVTLMWASIEKWAYPEWSYPLLIQHPWMTLGFSPDFFMRSAGAVEFALAFGLMWTPLIRRFAAVILAAMFVSAVFEFGKIDLIGHALIVMAMLAISADQGGKSQLVRYPWLVPVGYAASLTGFIALYYSAHALLFGTSTV